MLVDAHAGVRAILIVLVLCLNKRSEDSHHCPFWVPTVRAFISRWYFNLASPYEVEMQVIIPHCWGVDRILEWRQAMILFVQ